MKQPKAENCCVALKWNVWIFWSVDRSENYFVLKHPIVEIQVHFPPRKYSKTFNLTKIGCFPCNRILKKKIFEMVDDSMAEGNTFSPCNVSVLVYWAIPDKLHPPP